MHGRVCVEDPGLASASFTYAGDGSGDIKLRLGPSAFNNGRFGGAVDELVLSVLAHSSLTGYSTTQADYVVGVTIPDNHPRVAGATSIGFAIFPELPAGLVMNPLTGVITGTPL